MTAAGGMQRLAARIVDKIHALAAAAMHAHCIVGERAGVNVAVGGRLKTDAVDRWYRSCARKDSSVAALKIATNYTLLQRVWIRRQQSRGRAAQPVAVEKQVLGAHKSAVPNLDASRMHSKRE